MTGRPVTRVELELEVTAARQALDHLSEVARDPALSQNGLSRTVEQLEAAIEELAVAAEELQSARSRSVELAQEAGRERLRYKELFELAPDGYLVTDGDGVIQEANRAAGQLLGVGPDLLHGKPLVLFFPEEDRAAFHRRLRTLHSSKMVSEWEARLVPRGGEARPVSIRCGGSQAEPTAALRFLIHDLTAVQRAEEREKATLREHSQRMASLERTKSDFLRLASHELRGPLAVLRGYLSMMSDGSLGKLPPKAGKALPVMAAKLHQMQRLIAEMLDSARLEDSRLELRKETFDLVPVVRNSVEVLLPTAGKHHELRIRAPRQFSVHADQGRVETILANLLDNAIKYSPDGGRVEIQVAGSNAEALVSVTDPGVGIASEDLSTVFRPFGRVVTPDNSHIGGTGLGLYLCRELARMHGGELELASKPGVGTTVTLRLPRAPAASARTA